MPKPQKKEAKYPMAGIRISEAIKVRATKIARLKTKTSSRKVTMSEVLRWCIDAHLPKLEKLADEVAAKAKGLAS